MWLQAGIVTGQVAPNKASRTAHSLVIVGWSYPWGRFNQIPSPHEREHKSPQQRGEGNFTYGRQIFHNSSSARKSTEMKIQCICKS